MNMIEKVARAIASGAGRRQLGAEHIQWYADNSWKYYIDDARTAIEAMREPTEGMKIKSGIPVFNANLVWQDMIDVALNEK